MLATKYGTIVANVAQALSIMQHINAWRQRDEIEVKLVVILRRPGRPYSPNNLGRNVGQRAQRQETNCVRRRFGRCMPLGIGQRRSQERQVNNEDYARQWRNIIIFIIIPFE